MIIVSITAFLLYFTSLLERLYRKKTKCKGLLYSLPNWGLGFLRNYWVFYSIGGFFGGGLSVCDYPFYQFESGFIGMKYRFDQLYPALKECIGNAT